MYLFCPKCHSQHAATSRCPKCSSRLLSPIEAADALGVSVALPPDLPASTFAGRVGVGCVVALGLHLAFREWTTAAVGPSAELAHTVALAIGFLLRLVSAGVGGVVTGAGRRQNFSGGAVVGLVCGLAWLLVDDYPQIVIDPLRGGLVGAMVVAAGLAAMAAGRVWPEPVVVPDAPSPRDSSLMALRPTNGPRRTGRPTQWLRVTIAAGMAIVGISQAETMRTGLRELPAGLVQLGGPAAASRVDFQLTVVAVMLAAVVAGSGTGAGFRHGVFAGILAAIGVVILRSTAEPEALPGLDWLAEAICPSDAPARNVEMALAGAALAAMTVGGWLGGQLFPPLRRTRKMPRERY